MKVQRVITNKNVLFILLSVLLLSGVTLAKAYLSYSDTLESSRVALANQYLEVAEDIASGVDLHTYQEVLSTKKKDASYYRIRSYLNDFIKTNHVLYIYTLLLDDTDVSKVLVTATPPEVDVGTFPATLPPNEVRESKLGNNVYTDIINDKEYGKYLTVGAPIKNPDGQVIGVIGIDIDANHLSSIGKKTLLENNYKFLAVDLAFMVLILFIIFFAQFWYKRLVKKDAKESELFYLGELNKIIGSLKTIRHDFNNHFHVLNGLMEMRHYEEAASYLKSLVEETALLDLSLKVKHPALLVLFSTKQEYARSKSIEIVFDCGSDYPQHYESSDLIKIFSNLIDNAVEATELLPKESRYIRVTMKLVGQTYIFAVENTANFSPDSVASIFDSPYSTKGADRGRGLSIVKRTVEKYKGEIYHDYKGGRFTVQIILRNQ